MATTKGVRDILNQFDSRYLDLSYLYAGATTEGCYIQLLLFEFGVPTG